MFANDAKSLLTQEDFKSVICAEGIDSRRMLAPRDVAVNATDHSYVFILETSGIRVEIKVFFKVVVRMLT